MTPLLKQLYITSLAMFWLIPLLAWLMFDEKNKLTAKLWLSGMISYAIVVTVFFMAPNLPGWTTNLTMTFSTLTVLLFTESIRLEYQNKKTNWLLLIGIVATQDVLTFYAWSLGLHTKINIPSFLIFTTILEVMLIYRMVIVFKMYRSKAMLVLISFFSLVIIANLARVINQLVGNSSGQLTDNSAVSNAAFVVYLTSVIFYSFGYGIFVSEKTKFKLNKALEGERIATEHKQSAVALLKERDGIIKRLARLQKSVQTSALSSTIAHEINQPLAVIKLEAQHALTQLNDINQSKLKELLEQIVKNTNRSAQIVRTIQTIFDDSSEQVETRPLKEVIESVYKLLKPQAQSYDIEIKLENNPSSIEVTAIELEHVLINLINNAIDSLRQSDSSPKVINISTKINGGGAIIQISDNGTGITPEQSNHLFDLMQSSKEKGSGIGLWLCQFIVERWGGKIELLEPSNKGATFNIQIPANSIKRT